MKTEKQAFRGAVVSIQPRIRLLRSFDQRSHSYLGYALLLSDTLEGDTREFWIGVGKGVLQKHSLQVGDELEGMCVAVADTRKETVEFYRVSGLLVSHPAVHPSPDPPPWHDHPPTLETYRQRGHRRLDKRAWAATCRTCLWACHMPVEMIVDQWDPGQVQYRTETFCYGPKSCPAYRLGPTRKVPGRRGMSWEEEDWVDEQETAHRGPDD